MAWIAGSQALTFLLEGAGRLRTAGGLRGAVQVLQAVVVAHILHGGELIDAKVLVPVFTERIISVKNINKLRKTAAETHLKAILSLK